MRRLRTVLTIGVAALATLALPATAGAAVTLGKTFTPTQNCLSNPTTYYGATLPAATDAYKAPSNGVITSWTFTTGATGQAAIKLKVGVNGTGRQMTTLAQSAPVELPPYTARANPTRLPIAAGQRIGFSIVGGSVCFSTNQGDGDTVILRDADHQPGTTTQFLEVGSWMLPVSARVEADADADGYGDETQDACPSVAGPGACPAPPVPLAPSTVAAPAPDNVRPALTGISFSRDSFATSRGKSKTPVGAKVSFALSERGSVKFTVERESSGRKVSGRCKTRTRANRSKPKCILWAKVDGSVTVAGKPGKNSFTFTGKLGGKALKVGSYRLTGKATDGSRNASLPKRKAFSVVK